MKHCQHVGSYPLPIPHKNLCSHCQVTALRVPVQRRVVLSGSCLSLPHPHLSQLRTISQMFLVGRQSFRLLVGVILQVSNLRDTGFKFYPSYKLDCYIDFPSACFLHKQQCLTLSFKSTWKHFKLLMPKPHPTPITSEFLG